MIAVQFPYGRHTTAKHFDQLRSTDVLEIFADEEPDQVHLYLSDGVVRRFVRSVDTTSPEHLASVLDAWSTNRRVIDHRPG